MLQTKSPQGMSQRQLRVVSRSRATIYKPELLIQYDKRDIAFTAWLACVEKIIYAGYQCYVLQFNLHFMNGLSERKRFRGAQFEIAVQSDCDTAMPEMMFVRPVSDAKLIQGMVLPPGTARWKVCEPPQGHDGIPQFVKLQAMVRCTGAFSVQVKDFQVKIGYKEWLWPDRVFHACPTGPPLLLLDSCVPGDTEEKSPVVSTSMVSEHGQTDHHMVPEPLCVAKNKASPPGAKAPPINGQASPSPKQASPNNAYINNNGGEKTALIGGLNSEAGVLQAWLGRETSTRKAVEPYHSTTNWNASPRTTRRASSLDRHNSRQSIRPQRPFDVTKPRQFGTRNSPEQAQKRVEMGPQRRRSDMVTTGVSSVPPENTLLKRMEDLKASRDKLKGEGLQRNPTAHDSVHEVTTRKMSKEFGVNRARPQTANSADPQRRWSPSNAWKELSALY